MHKDNVIESALGRTNTVTSGSSQDVGRKITTGEIYLGKQQSERTKSDADNLS